jgi:hypothetical protein
LAQDSTPKRIPVTAASWVGLVRMRAPGESVLPLEKQNQ